MESIVSNLSVIIIGIAAICTMISIITEFTKEMGVLKKIPTDLHVLMVSMIVCIMIFFAYIAYADIKFMWYYLIAVVLAAFLIAMICCRGWSFVIEIWKRFYIKLEKAEGSK